MKPTPGPWVNEWGTIRTLQWHRRLDNPATDAPIEICEVVSEPTNPITRQAALVEEQIENGRLLAASPDMLNALENAWGFLDGRLNGWDFDHGGPEHDPAQFTEDHDPKRCAWCSVRDALKAATGKEPT